MSNPFVTNNSANGNSLYARSGNTFAPSYSNLSNAAPFPQNVRMSPHNPPNLIPPNTPYLPSGFMYSPVPNGIPFYMPSPPPPLYSFNYNVMPTSNVMQPPTSDKVPNSPAELKAIEDYIVGLLNQSKINNPATSEQQANATTPQPSLAVPEEKKEDIVTATTTTVESQSIDSQPQQKRTGKSNKNKHKDKLHNLDELNGNIMELFNSLKPNANDLNKRLKLLSKLQKLVNAEWPDANPDLHLFGSSANEFGFNNADIDISLIIDESKSGAERTVVQTLGELLKKKQMRNVKTLPRARVPIVKFSDPTSNISCDICINNHLALHNTQLLADYSKIDPRVQPLGFVVKYWAKRRQINEPYQGTLSSYAYILMVLHFLQQRKPAVIPCLQQFHDPEDPLPHQRVDVDGYDCYYYKKIDRLKDFGKENKETVGELLYAFFRWYACEFDWDNAVISVRTGKFLSKVEKHWDHKTEDSRDNFYLTIEDPFEITHNLGRIVDVENLKVLKYEFDRGYRLLSRSETLKTVCKRFTSNEEKL